VKLYNFELFLKKEEDPELLALRNELLNGLSVNAFTINRTLALKHFNSIFVFK